MPSVSRAPDARRPLGLVDLLCVGVNAVVGSSIFLFPGRLAGSLGPASVLAFALTGLLVSSVALCFAEAASRFDRPGGSYLYARAAFGPGAGFAIGWMCWVTQVLGWAAVANGIAVYLGHFGPVFGSPAAVKGTAAAVILAMGALNYRGVKLGAWTSDFFTVAKLLPLGLFVLAGLPLLRSWPPGEFAPSGLAPMGGACFLAYFAFQGFESVPVPSGEADRPERNVPLATLGAVLLAAFLYMLVQAVAVAAHPGLASSPRPLADAAARVLGPAGAALMVAAAALSMTGYNAGAALVSPRYLLALAEDGHLPGRLAALHPRYGTPHAAVALTTGITLTAALLLDFQRLVDFSNVVVSVQYFATCLAVPLLRRSGPAPVRLPGGWLIPLAGMGATAWLGLQGGWAELRWSLAALAAGIALRSLSVRSGAALPAPAGGAPLPSPRPSAV